MIRKCYELNRKPQETQALAFLAVFVYATHATQAIAFEWKPGLSHHTRSTRRSRQQYQLHGRGIPNMRSTYVLSTFGPSGLSQL